MPRLIAAAMPGKIGDLLYILPSMKYICERDGVKVDVYTSEYCRAAERIFRAQSYVNDFIIPPEYKIDNDGQGIQPWQMPVRSGYERVYQLGFEQFPYGELHKFIGMRAGLGPEEVPWPSYEFEDKGPALTVPYVTIATKRSFFGGDTTIDPSYYYVIDQLKKIGFESVQIGRKGDFLPIESHDFTGIDMLDTLSILNHSKVHIGYMTGALVLANGIQHLQKVTPLPHPGCGEQHALYSNKNVYMMNPSGPVLLGEVKKYL
jgi:hypothetical protein